MSEVNDNVFIILHAPSLCPQLPSPPPPAPQGHKSFGLLFDIDGVLVRGRTPIPEAKQCFRNLVDGNGRYKVPVVFVTNAGNCMRQTKAEHLSHLLDVEVNWTSLFIFTAPSFLCSVFFMCFSLHRLYLRCLQTRWCCPTVLCECLPSSIKSACWCLGRVPWRRSLTSILVFLDLSLVWFLDSRLMLTFLKVCVFCVFSAFLFTFHFVISV